MKEYKFKINGNEYNVAINSVEGNIADVTVNGKSYQVGSLVAALKRRRKFSIIFFIISINTNISCWTSYL